MNNPEPAHGARDAIPTTAARPIPAEGEPGDAAAGLLQGRGQAAAVHRQGGVQPREGEHPVLEQVPAGLLRRLGHQLRHVRPGRADVRARATPCVTETMEKQGIRLSTSVAVSDASTWASTCSTRWSAATIRAASARASCGRRSRSRSTTRSTSRSSSNGRGIPAQGPIAPGIFGYREGKEGINPVVYEWDGRRTGAQVDRGARRSCSPRPAIRTASTRRTGAPLVLNFDVTARSVDARSPCSTGCASSSRRSTSSSSCAHRLQPLPGQDPQGQRPDLRLGLARRLSRPGELPVPAARAAGQGEEPGRERLELRERRVRPPVRAA